MVNMIKVLYLITFTQNGKIDQNIVFTKFAQDGKCDQRPIFIQVCSGW